MTNANDHVCTLAEAAAVDFEPISTEERDKINSAFDAKVRAHHTTFRISAAVMSRTKEELQSMSELSDEDFGRLLESLAAGQEFFRDAADILKSAEMRIFCSLAALGDEDGGAD
jgi:hypothetical protein